MDFTMPGFALPFTFGDTYWLPIGTPQRVTSPCPVCAGQLAVTVILGSGERIGVPCEACGKGYDGPRGVIEEWEALPTVRRFTITGVVSFSHDEWWVRDVDGAQVKFSDLKASESEAWEKARAEAAATHERNMQSRQVKRRNVANATWSLHYHRKQIADLERQIAWHQSKLLHAKGAA